MDVRGVSVAVDESPDEKNREYGLRDGLIDAVVLGVATILEDCVCEKDGVDEPD